MDSLQELRAQIDEVDERILELFSQRMDITSQIGAYKREQGLPILDRAREREKVAAAAEAVPEELRDYATVLFSLLMEVSRANQHRQADETSKVSEAIATAIQTTPQLFPQSAFVACQGVEGAYSQIATDRLFKHASISYFDSFEAVFKAVNEGFCDFGVLPVENSSAGTVNSVYDLMMSNDFYIVRSARLKVDHALLGVAGTKIENVREIYSHQQAIDQSQAFLNALSDVTVHVCENTAIAAKMVADRGDITCAALSSRSCAELYDLEVIAKNVQDQNNNYTRFACIAKDLAIYPGADRSSLMMIVNHEPGALYKVLARFYSLDINLVKLESRPIPDRDFEFMFYFDLDCPVAAPELKVLLDSLDDVCEEWRYLGSYSEVI